MIGVFGGTFDPIHFGHLRPALDCLQGLPLAQVRFVPLNVAVHRAQPVAPAELRLAMLKAAIRSQAGFVADDRELARAGSSYTYDTLCSLRDEVGATCPLCLLIGADAFGGLADWYRPMDILDLAHLVVMRRPGHRPSPQPTLHDLYSERVTERAGDLSGRPSGRILIQDVTQVNISSTQIRGLLSRGLSPRYLLPDGALEVIEREGLYL